MEMPRACANCSFWQSSGGSRTCRRRAPVVGPYGFWPETFPDDWCGEFKAAEVRSSERVTIKKMAMKVLEDGPLTTQEMVALIPEIFEHAEVTRERLSPQLSRLRQQGLLQLHGKVWSLKTEMVDG